MYERDLKDLGPALDKVPQQTYLDILFTCEHSMLHLSMSNPRTLTIVLQFGFYLVSVSDVTTPRFRRGLDRTV
jgi:hypothetical protein